MRVLSHAVQHRRTCLEINPPLNSQVSRYFPSIYNMLLLVLILDTNDASSSNYSRPTSHCMSLAVEIPSLLHDFTKIIETACASPNGYTFFFSFFFPSWILSPIPAVCMYLLSTHLHLPLGHPAGRVQRGIVQLRLRTDDQAAVARELEVGRPAAQVDLAHQLARGVPDVHAVAAAPVHVAGGVGVHAVRRARVRKGEGLAALPGPILLDVESVSLVCRG